MQITAQAPWLTIGAVIALLVLVLAILGIVGALPYTAPVVFGLVAALAVARLL
jgi:hypothetical protein